MSAATGIREMQPDTVVYRIDADDRLVYVNAGWDRFAIENDSAHLVAEQVLHTRIWDFIEDPETRHLHQVLVRRVRSDGQILKLPFRCDSPSVRRDMTMEILPAGIGYRSHVEYHCHIDRIERRAPVLLPEQCAWRSSRRIRMCSWCKMIHVDGEGWVETQVGVERLRLFDRRKLPEITHTICDPCLRDLYD